ncbi:MAG: hypothetical protein MUF49_15735 [Oculatellaceae cyanobacterium Prado106]|nr:hypothetical protein [Oculatellaceae cyanobacterium Prado106]
MAACPCCSTSMLRHIRHRQVYWFCRSCWQEMPLIEPLSIDQDSLERSLLSPSLPKLNESRMAIGVSS